MRSCFMTATLAAGVLLLAACGGGAGGGASGGGGSEASAYEPPAVEGGSFEAYDEEPPEYVDEPDGEPAETYAEELEETAPNGSTAANDSAAGLPDGSLVGEVKAQPYAADMAGVHAADSGKTYGEAIDAMCPGGVWEEGVAVDAGYADMVQYRGGESKYGTVLIQWMRDDAGWTVTGMLIDDAPVATAQVITMFYEAQ
jgi:hypothetical protein